MSEISPVAPARNVAPAWHDFAVPVFGGRETHKDTGRPYTPKTLLQVFTMVPLALPKLDSKAFIPSTYREHDAREHAAQRDRGKYVALTADIDTGDQSLEIVLRAVQSFVGSSAWLVYSSASSRPGHRKWRVIVPLTVPVSHVTWRAGQDLFYDHLANAGIEPDPMLLRAGQIVYLPNVPAIHDKSGTPLRESGLAEGAVLYFDRAVSELTADGLDLLEGKHSADVMMRALAAEAEAEIAREDRQKAAEDAARKRADRAGTGATLIERFNAAHSLAELMIEYEYVDAPHSSVDWRSPHQTNGSYATQIRIDDDGEEYWISLSGSDAEAGLGNDCDGFRYGDAFDLFVHYEHGGDVGAALRAWEATEDLASISATLALPPIEQVSGIADRDTGAATAPRFRLDVYWSGAPLPPVPPSLLPNILPRIGVGGIVAPSMAGKTTLVLELGRTLAVGQPFFGSSAKERCGVLVLAAEGMAGLRGRAYVLSPDGITIPVAVSYLSGLTGPADLEALAEAVTRDVVPAMLERFGVRLGAVVIDTLSSSGLLPDENDNGAAAGVIAAMNGAAMALDCLFLFVHHPAKQGTAARGAYALHANVDVEITIDYEEGKPLRIVRLTKHKDAPAPRVLGCYTLQDVPVGVDEYGDPVTACRIVIGDYSDELKAKAGKAATLSAEQIRACQERIEGGEWRAAVQCGSSWAGHAIGKALGIDTSEKEGRTSVQAILNWLTVEGWLRIVPERDPVRRKIFEYVRVGATVEPDTATEGLEN